MSLERFPDGAGLSQPIETDEQPMIIIANQSLPLPNSPTETTNPSKFERFGRKLTTLIAIGATALAVGILSPPEDKAHASTNKYVEVGMPFAGRWGSSASGQANSHARWSGGQFAQDIFENDEEVKLNVTNPGNGALSFAWAGNWDSCNGKAGKGVRIAIKVDNEKVGEVVYSHLDQAVTSGDINNNMVLGKTKKWDTVDGCWEVSTDAGVHTHFEAKSDTGNFACYYPRDVGASVENGAPIARIGKTSATQSQQPCTEPPGSGGGATPPTWTSADLFEIQNWNSPTGVTEVKELPAANSYQSWGNGYKTNDSWHPGGNVDYGMGDFNGDGVQDIIKVQHQSTASGMTEARVFNGADQFKAGNPLVTPDGHHGANDVDYVVADYNRDGRPDIYRIMHWNTGSGKTEIRVLDGATNYATWLTPTFVTPDGWHGGGDVDYAASTCGTTNHPNVFVVLHRNTRNGLTEVKRLDGNSNYTSWNGGWETIDGEHSSDDVNYVAGECNQNTGLPNIFTVLHKNTTTGHTEVKRMDGSIPGSGSFSRWNGGWVTPDGEHSSHDVDFVMAQRNN
ncbi:MAG: FG-GAP repeat domain-containing protein [Candidatus Saccharimonadales bacterium]